MSYKKGQSLVELGLLFAFVAVIAVVAFTPIGKNVQEAFIKMSPHKVSIQNLSPVVGGSANAQKIETAVQTLNNGSEQAQSAATFVNETLSVAAMVSSGQNSSLSNEQVKQIATVYKSSKSVETSGSLASFIATEPASMPNENEKTALETVKEVLGDSQITVTSTSNLGAAINALTGKPANSTSEIIDAVLLACEKLDDSSATAEQKELAQAVIDDFKVALSVK
jgi:hypothetical protein